MPPITLDAHQQALVGLPLDARIFLEGPAGTGKTAAGVARLLRLLHEGISAAHMLLLVPQRTLAAPYDEALRQNGLPAGGLVSVLTMGGLAQRMVDLYWPLVAEVGCFAHPERPPVFLTLESAQYYMARLVQPLLDDGYFESITVDRNRLYSQILDNLNKAAVAGFPCTEIAGRLRAAWTGESSQTRVFDEAQECALRFREYCLVHNLLDFSLQLELFVRHLWPLPACRDYLLGQYTHLIVDNVEEDTAVTHDVLRTWLPASASALIICDHGGGYRRFLGADPGGAGTLSDVCTRRLTFTRSYVTSIELRALAYHLGRALGKTEPVPQAASSLPPGAPSPELMLPVFGFQYHRFYPQMVDWTAGEIERLVCEEGVPPGQIAVLAPFMTDALRFLLMSALDRRGVPARSHRPSRALRDEPAARCMLTLAMLAHPGWCCTPPQDDVVQALVEAIEGMDLVRAQLLAEVLYRPRDGAPVLSSFDAVEPETQERITFLLGGRYERLRAWLAAYAAEPAAELDHFFSRVFGEVLAQPGFGFHAGLDAGEVAANLIESAGKFRRSAALTASATADALGREYVQLVKDGVVAAQYVRSWRAAADDAVLLAPAHTFLMSNRPVDYQFWLDVGSKGWWERLYQPLTQPYVLARSWPPGKLWGDREEFETRQDALYCLTAGLIRRCRRKVYLSLSELGTEGVEQQGPLLRAVQRVRRWAATAVETRAAPAAPLTF